MDDERLARLSALAFAPFRARAPWWGGDLQTLRNYFRSRATLESWPNERLVLALDDGSGDRLAASLSAPAASAAAPLVILIHGLSGDEDSHYMRGSASTLLAEGYRVLRLNLRGAGPSRPLSRFQYHAGRTADLAAALRALPAALTAHGTAAVGYSLGGNMLLKFLGERGARVPLQAAVSVSAPIDLAATSLRVAAWRNGIYQAHVLHKMRAEALAPASELTRAEHALLPRVRSIRDFDERFTVPRNDFRSVAHYYDESSARHYLDGIGVPTLVVHALDDPWVPADAYRAYRWSANPYLVPLLPPGGGHVGFHASGDPTPWHDRAIAQFLAGLFNRA